MPVRSSTNMAAAQDARDVVPEYPTKFGKYKQLLASRHASQTALCGATIPAPSLPAIHNNGNHMEETSRLATEDPIGRPFNGHYAPPTNYTVPSPHFHRPVKSEQMEDLSDMPLNLTVSSSRCKADRLPPQSPTLQPSGFASQSPQPVISRPVITEYDNHIVDEHFQRSLGSVYTTLRTGGTPPTSCRSSPKCSPPPLREPSNPDSTSHGRVSVTGSVDEHFSKSLGDLWTKVKSSSPPSGIHAEPMDCDQPSPSSVDDHFAKALGDTWFKMQSRGGNTHRAALVSSSIPSPPQSASPLRYSSVAPR